MTYIYRKVVNTVHNIIFYKRIRKFVNNTRKWLESHVMSRNIKYFMT